jgi:hypothetical protein
VTLIAAGLSLFGGGVPVENREPVAHRLKKMIFRLLSKVKTAPAMPFADLSQSGMSPDGINHHQPPGGMAKHGFKLEIVRLLQMLNVVDK